MIWCYTVTVFLDISLGSVNSNSEISCAMLQAWTATPELISPTAIFVLMITEKTSVIRTLGCEISLDCIGSGRTPRTNGLAPINIVGAMMMAMSRPLHRQTNDYGSAFGCSFPTALHSNIGNVMAILDYKCYGKQHVNGKSHSPLT